MMLIALIILERKKMLERSLKSRIDEMEFSLRLNNPEKAKENYKKIKGIYAQASTKTKEKYHQRIVELYQRTLRFG